MSVNSATKETRKEEKKRLREIEQLENEKSKPQEPANKIRKNPDRVRDSEESMTNKGDNLNSNQNSNSISARKAAATAIDNSTFDHRIDAKDYDENDVNWSDDDEQSSPNKKSDEDEDENDDNDSAKKLEKRRSKSRDWVTGMQTAMTNMQKELKEVRRTTTGTGTVMQVTTIPTLTKTENPSIQKWIRGMQDYQTNSSVTLSKEQRNNHIDTVVKRDIHLKAMGTKHGVVDATDLFEWEDEKFYAALRKIFNLDPTADTVQTVEMQLNQDEYKLKHDTIVSDNGLEALARRWADVTNYTGMYITKSDPKIETKREKGMVDVIDKTCIGRVPTNTTGSPMYWFINKFRADNPTFSDLTKLFQKFAQTTEECRDLQKEMMTYGVNLKEFRTKQSHDQIKRSGGKQPSTTTESSNSSSYTKKEQHGGGGASESRTDTWTSCKLCGRRHAPGCDQTDHADRNQSDLPWKDSEKGKAWKALNYDHLPNGKLLATAKPRNAAGYQGKKDTYKGSKKPRACESEYLYSLLPASTDELIDVVLVISERVHTQSLRALVDTGALDGNYVSQPIAAMLKKLGVVSERCNANVCSALTGGKCCAINEIFNLRIIIRHEHTFEEHSFSISAKVINIDYDLIIGRNTIREIGLVDLAPSQFYMNKGAMIQDPTNDVPNKGEVYSEAACAAKSLSSPVITSASTEEGNGSCERTAIGELDLKKRTGDSASPDDTIATTTTVDNETTIVEEDNPLIPKAIHGPKSLRTEVRALCLEFIDIFDNEVRPIPADVPPMKVDVDIDKWEALRSNKLPARAQTATKQAEITKQIASMLGNRVIEPSRAASYSQIHMTPKPGDKWRFCIDFIVLNLCTVLAHNWPIPNIKEMLQRLGQRKPKYIGIMDLVSGYHQAPLHPASSVFTAFIAFCGLYHWLRVPMGLKGAASYFQFTIASVVLAGLMYIICEAYLDDIITTGRTETEFVHNLRQIFQRFREKRITINPHKCRLGLSEAQFVGHVINEEGISFTREKKDSVLDFPKPKSSKQLKSFLGMANYFRDHIKDHSRIAYPLNQLLKNYDKNRPVDWTEETSAAFEAMKVAIHECPMLFFANATDPIHVYTDASDYGMGGYIAQEVDNIERPIAFMSKTFHDEQLNWHTLDKEAYAIFYIFMTYQYLLRDVTATVHTDHKNLTHLHEGSAPKVRR